MVGGLTLVSRVLGLVRDFLTAGVFGTSLAMSAFVVAFRVPNLFRALFGEGALSSAFVPVFIQARRQEGDAVAWQLARKVITLVGLALLAVVFVGVVAAGLLARHSGLSDKFAMVFSLTRIMLPYMFFICLAALAMAILNSYHRFALPALTPSLLNLTWISFVLLVCPRLGATPEQQIYGLAWGVFTAGVLQLSLQVPALLRRGYRPGVSFDWRDPRVFRVFTLMGPAALGLAVTQVNVMIDSLLATWIGDWAPSSLFYAERLLYLPQGILATAMSTVLLPVLSGHASQQRLDDIRTTLQESLRTLLFVMVPAAIGLLVLARPIIQTLFEWGRFTEVSTNLTARALMFYAPGLFVFCLAKVFVPAFYAMQDTRTPVRVGLVSVAMNFTLNIIFILTLPTYWKHAGLALSTVISESFNGLTLGWLLHRRLGGSDWRGVLRAVGRFLGIGVFMGVTAVAVRLALWNLANKAGIISKVAQIIALLGGIGAAILLYVLLSALLRYPELREVRQALLARGGSAESGGTEKAT